MDLQRSYIFIVFTVIIIHEVVLSECDLETKTNNRFIKSYANGFQRKERQAPTDPSRMYLPPKVDSVASGGFGDRNVQASNNFGDNAAGGYGEVTLAQDASDGGQAAAAGAGSSYDAPAKTADDGWSSSGEKTPAAVAPDRSSFGRYSQTGNADDYGGGTVTGDRNDELLTTAQNRGPTPNTDYRYGGQSGPGAGQGGAGQYGGRLAAATGSSGYRKNAGPNAPTSPRDDGRNGASAAYGRGNGDGPDRKWDPAFTGGQTTASYGRDANAASYAQQVGVGAYDPAATATVAGSVGLPSGNPQGGGYDREATAPGYGPSSPGGDGLSQESAGEYGGRLATGTGSSGYRKNAGPNAPSSPRDDGRNGASAAYGRGNGDGPDLQKRDPAFTGGQTTASYGREANAASYAQQVGGGPYDPAATATVGSPSGNHQGGGYDREATAAGYGPSSPGGGFDSNGQVTASDADGYHYGSVQSADSGGPLAASLPDGFDGQSTAAYGPAGSTRSQDAAYGPTRSQDAAYGPAGPTRSQDAAGGNPVQGQSTVTANGPGGFDQGTTGPRPQSSSGSSDGYGQRSPANGQNNDYGYGPASSQSSPSAGDGYGGRNPPAYGGRTRGPQGSTRPSDRNNNYAQPADTPRNGLPARGSAGGSTGTSSGVGGRPCHTSGGENGLSGSTSSRTPTNSRHEPQNKKKYSTVVPKAQYQNSNLPGNGDFEKQGNGIQNANNNGDFGEPNSNAFSNFAPDNQLNPPVNLNDKPGPNAFSNFAPDNQLNPPVNLNDKPGPNAFSNFAPDNQLNPLVNLNDKPEPNAFSNFAPGNQLNPPVNLNDKPGSNAFSNFAPDNQLNPPINLNDNNGNYGEPSPNAFSNFAPGNQPNPPINLNNDNGDFSKPGSNSFSNYAPGTQPNSPTNLNNNCGTNNHGNNRNTQYDSIFSVLNTGY